MHLILGTAGHIDHGKSSLVRALTGTDPDRLPEEKSRGVTIDLGFAHLSLAPANSGSTYEIGIIDVPGHADFVNNMVSGVGALDLAVFIIAADDGWMPQSEEHLHILSYLGVRNIVIAMTKADLCDDVPFAIEMLRDELKDTSIADVPIVPVSSITGEGIDTLKSTLIESLQGYQPPAEQQKPRLAIDRLFSPKGAGTVVTGTLTGGSVGLGETLVLQPLGLPAKVRYIQNHSQELDQAQPGMRTALNLPDLPIAGPGKPGAERGHILTKEHCGETTDTLDVRLERLARPIPGYKPRALRHTETVILHHGSARCQARVILHDRQQLEPGETCLAQLRLDQPVFLLNGDRVVLRDGSQQNTLAGGTVLDALAQRQAFRTPERATFLQPRSKAPLDLEAQLQTALYKNHILDAANPLPNSPFSDATINRHIELAISKGSLQRIDQQLIDVNWWKDILDSASHSIRSWHQQHPNLPTMPLESLEKTLTNQLPTDTFPLVITALEEREFSRQGKGIAHSSHQLTLPEHLKQEAADILQTLKQAGLQPPNKSELCSSNTALQALEFLCRSGEAVEIDPKIVLARSCCDQAAAQVEQLIQQQGQATASEIRQHLDSTRKIVMPLLEFFDSQGLTRRDGNHRTLA